MQSGRINCRPSLYEAKDTAIEFNCFSDVKSEPFLNHLQRHFGSVNNSPFLPFGNCERSIILFTTMIQRAGELGTVSKKGCETADRDDRRQTLGAQLLKILGI